VDAVERFADGMLSVKELDAARRVALRAAEDCLSAGFVSEGRADFNLTVEYSTYDAECYASRAASEVTHVPTEGVSHCYLMALETAARAAKAEALANEPDSWTWVSLCHVGYVAKVLEEHEQAALLRDIFGYPLRATPAFDPSVLAWKHGAVMARAQAAYENRILPSGQLDNVRLGILADALEDAGASEKDLLAHLRGPGPHVRGCWALDLLLGKR
jgi:hypothetical protein